MELNKIYNGDCLEVLKTFPSESVDCIVTSPPYNKGFYGKRSASKYDVWKQRNIEYGDYKDNMKPEDYILWQKNILQELIRVLKPKGSIFYNTKSFSYKHRLVYPTYVFDFNVRQQIIWDRKNTPQISPIRFYPTTEYIFWITKTNIQPKFYRVGKFNSEVWQISPKPMKEHPAPFPEELVEQCIVSTTDKNDIVLDCFMGSGTTGVVAKKLGRKYVGIELNPEYCKIAENRINSILI